MTLPVNALFYQLSQPPCADEQDQYEPQSVALNAVTQRNYPTREPRQFGTERSKDVLKSRHHKYQNQNQHDAGNAQHRTGIDQRGANGGAQGL